MTEQEIIGKVEKMVRREAYKARVLEELLSMNFDAAMMKFYRDMAYGKAGSGLEILRDITDESHEAVYEQAVEEATLAILKTNGDVVELLNLAGFDGKAYCKAA